MLSYNQSQVMIVLSVAHVHKVTISKKTPNSLPVNEI